MWLWARVRNLAPRFASCAACRSTSDVGGRRGGGAWLGTAQGKAKRLLSRTSARSSGRRRLDQRGALLRCGTAWCLGDATLSPTRLIALAAGST